MILCKQGVAQRAGVRARFCRVVQVFGDGQQPPAEAAAG